MHQASSPYLKHRNINKYFKKLSDIIAKRGIGPYNILVVGK